MANENLLKHVNNNLTDKDIEFDSTAQSILEFETLIGKTPIPEQPDMYLDIGCGSGGLTIALGEYFNAEDIHGIDNNSDLLSTAKTRNIETHNIDLINRDKLPFEDNSIDIITCLGTLEHLPNYDIVLKEISRLLSSDGVAILAVPNLSSWVNRLSLLFGYQPRNVEISESKTVNIAPWYDNSEEVLYHLHAPTYRGLIELLEYHDFEIVASEPLFPYQDSGLVKIIDSITRYRPHLSRRFSVSIQNS